VTLAENSSCVLGDTCRGTPDGAGTNHLGNGYFGLSANHLDSDYFDDNDRQTGEEFSSDAPADCRVTCS
jgi:hypothetical protein